MGRSSRLRVVVGPPAVVPGAIVTMTPVVVGANAPKSTSDKSIVVVVDEVVEMPFGLTIELTGGATGRVVVVLEVVVVVLVDVVVVVTGTIFG